MKNTAAARRKLPVSQISQTLQNGAAAQSAGDLPRAEFFYQTILRDHPKHADALNLMGTLALEAKKYDVALGYFRKALKQHPRGKAYLYNQASAQLHLNKAQHAVETLRKATGLYPTFAKFWVLSGRAQAQLGQHDAALAAYDKALALQSDDPAIAVERADVLVNLGQMDAAAAVFRQAIAAGQNTVKAMAGLSVAHKFQADDPEPDAMLAALDAPALTDAERKALRYATGKALADQKRYDAAFAQFTAAKTEAKDGFSMQMHREAYGRIKQIFTADQIAEKAVHGHLSERPVFIVGMPRSGTTLTEQILASHPQIAGAGELSDLRKIARTLGRGDLDPGKFGQEIGALGKGQIRKLASQYLSVLKQHSSSAARVVDKLPHNFELIGLILMLFPKAKIIHCQRSAMDTCVSCYTHNFSAAHGYNGDLQTLGKYYRAYADLMAYWDKILRGRILHSRYEDLISDQESASRRLIDWVGLDWDPACLAFQKTERLVKTPSRWQVRQPIYKTSMRSWEKYAAHLGPLQKALGPLAE
ncbi:sulfotransferase [Yoonia sp. BS5-3]|uniref:Sulfotransferase n=1 Tax=Yoonia phaeophyticola TaxID=3137369 RepID=A0ABZ2UZ28_9RHOB